MLLLSVLVVMEDAPMEIPVRLALPTCTFLIIYMSALAGSQSKSVFITTSRMFSLTVHSTRLTLHFQ